MEPLIKCEHVDLGYENQDAVINVNMEVCPGDYLCIVGENGSGKSTLIKGLLGLLKPSGGKLTVAEELKTTGIGYLPQQTKAQKDFPATVTEVVRSGFLSSRGMRFFYTPKEKSTALMHMGKLGVLELKDRCYRELSGGQQQRIALARAILKDAPIVVLDEASSFADPENEAKIQKAFEALMKGKTVLMIAHRLSTVRNMDRILVIRDGEIAEEGKHDELLEKGGVYAAMWEEYQKAAQWKVGGAA